jgi:DNA-binding PadR family transcriptional regulator
VSTLSPTARVILGLLALRPRTGYEIKQVTDYSTRFFWGASYGQIYPELRRLESVGLVRSSDAPRGARRRRVYELTAEGRRALEAWLAGPEEIFEYRDEGLLKLFFGELVDSEQVRALVERRRKWYEEAGRHFRAIAAELGEIEGPSADVLRYGIDLMDWSAAWFEGLERRLTPPA